MVILMCHPIPYVSARALLGLFPAFVLTQRVKQGYPSLNIAFARDQLPNVIQLF